jgi:hypothetical protein
MKNIFETINKFYSHDKNIYHSIHHIKRMLKDYDKNRNDIFYHYPNLNDDIMIDIILWHDAGYLPGDKNNEVLASALYSNNTDRLNPIVINGILSTIPFIKKYDDNYKKYFSESQTKEDIKVKPFTDYEEQKEMLINNTHKYKYVILDSMGTES